MASAGVPLNSKDQRDLEQLYLLHKRQVEGAQPGTEIGLFVRLDRQGHIAKTSEVLPPALRLLGG